MEAERQTDRQSDCSTSHLPGAKSLPAALRAAQTCRYFVYSEADFEVFRPAGATRCKVPSSVPNFTPIGATTRV